MKKSFKLVSLFILSVCMILIGKEKTFAADNAPTTFTAVSYAMSNKPVGLETNNISVKKIKNGKYIYCYDVNDKVPNGITYTKKGVISDPTVNYIIAHGLTQDSNDAEFFSTQAALWIYLLDNNQMRDTEYGYINKIKTAMKNNPNNAVYSRISKILEDAKKYSQITMANVEIQSSNINFSLKDGYYVSEIIKVNKAKANYEISLKNAPSGTVTEKTTNGFIVRVPESSVFTGTTKFTVNVTANKYNTYKYSASSSVYQDMLVAYAEETSDSIDLSITKKEEPKPENPTKIVISKQDITNKGIELPGATLVIKDKDGKVIEQWVSGNSPKEFDKLPVGKYTLSETIAPEGYKLSTETISFEVKLDGSIEKVVMYNDPKDNTKIVISKQDITTEKELPGATLVIKDKDGKVIEQWVSGNSPKEFDKLPVGKYTLSETIAPEGYELSTETISFEVKQNGEIITKVMYNKPKEVVETIVKIVKVDINDQTKKLTGAVLVVRNSKGEEVYKCDGENDTWVIKGLEEGKYTVEEITAPNGYKKLDDVITFEVKNGSSEIVEVIVPNTPETIEIVEVPATGSFVSSLPYIIGGIVIIIGSVLIYRNAKKEQ